MKRIILPAGLTLLVLYCLLFPARMAHAAADGLALWYQAILPTLLPFCILSNIIVRTGVYDHIIEKINPFFQHIYPVRAPLIYPLIAGFLLGFPLGSKICADLYESGRISAREAEVTSCISNNFGPAFLYNYVAVGLLENKVPAWVLILSFYAPPLLLGRLLLCFQNNRPLQTSQCIFPERIIHPKKKNVFRKAREAKKPTSESSISMKILDAGIMDGFTTMLKLAGYILLSALLADMIKSMPAANPLISSVATGAVEITNGIQKIANLDADVHIKAALAVGTVNFGGISGLMQTNSMMKSTGFRRNRYIAFKLACSITGVAGISILCSFY